jgi:hypothetical protein
MAAVLAPLVLATTPPRADHSLRPFLNSSHVVGFWRASLRGPELNEKELQRLLWDGYAFSDMKRDNTCAVAETCKGPKIGVVSYDYTGDSAGLKDRHYVLVSLWRLAASLCADLAVHPPATMLSETQHNFGRKLSPSLWWDRYFHLPNNLKFINAAVPDMLPSVNVGPTDKPQNIARAWEAAKRRQQDGTPWRWSIDTGLFGLMREDRKRMAAIDCSDRPWGASELVLSKMKKARHGLTGSDSGPFSTLHLRRGDVVDQCDTSVASVVRYMKCSWKKTPSWSEPGNERLVVFTDETDEAYLQQVVAALSELPRWGGGVLHGDPVVAKQLNQDDQSDNFLVYAVASELMKAAQHKYEMRAIWGLKDCTACESHAFDEEDANGAAAM